MALARRRQIATFGQAAPWRSAGDTTLARIANGRTVVMRATFPLGILKNGIPAQLLVTRLDAATETKPWHTTRIWNAPADASIPGRSLFALIDDSGLVDGERVLVSAPVGASLSGVSIPFDAVVISEGAAWFYRALPDGAYERLPLDTTKTLPGGYFVKDGVHAGDKVVTGGTGLLLARETGGSSGEE